jgi:HSP20 family protein
VAMVTRVDPFREFDRLTERLLSSFGAPAMPMDAYRKDDAFYVQMDLPGVKPDDIELTVERNVLTVRVERPDLEGDDVEVLASERPHGTFTRQFHLGENLDTDKLEAEYDAGVLSIRIPVAEESKPRRIPIGGAAQARELAA